VFLCVGLCVNELEVCLVDFGLKWMHFDKSKDTFC